MSDINRSKKMVEEMALEAFLDTYPRLTSNTIEVISQSEPPDFIVLINGRETGLELTKIYAETPDEYLDQVIRLSGKKEATYEGLGIFERPTILLCYGQRPPLFDMRGFLDSSPSWIDFTGSKFAEIWLMDLSDEYYSPQDPRKPADLYCLCPADRRSFYEIERTRKPFG